jgi:hypothetical protein
LAELFENKFSRTEEAAHEAQRELELRDRGFPGIRRRPVLLLKADDEPLPEYAVPAADVPRELLRLEAALLETPASSTTSSAAWATPWASKAPASSTPTCTWSDDPAFVDEVYREVREKRKNVEKILFEVAERYAETLLRMEDDYLRERAVDIRDVTRRILRISRAAAAKAGRAGNAPHPRRARRRAFRDGRVRPPQDPGRGDGTGQPHVPHRHHGARDGRARHRGPAGRDRPAGGRRPRRARRRPGPLDPAPHAGAGRELLAGSPAAARSSRSASAPSRTNPPSRSTAMRSSCRRTSKCPPTWKPPGRAAPAASGCSAANISI